ncbi:MAG TPA: PP2C family serine/threonine-protein phosphatase [Trebonia sp.]
MTLVLRYAVRSDVGLLREGNEDSAYAGPRLLAVADGMGGHAAGEVASSLTIAAMAELDSEQTGADMLAALSSAVADANTRLQEMIAANPAVEGMGTTLTALLWADGHAAVCHIGDSRGYLLRDGELYQITHDHTLVQSLLDEGKLTAEEAASHPQRQLLRRALGGGDAEPDLQLREARVGDRYLLCSDGLSGVVSDETLRDTLEAFDDLDTVTRQLIELALHGGGPDNITCIVADVIDTADGNARPTRTPTFAGAAVNGPPGQLQDTNPGFGPGSTPVVGYGSGPEPQRPSSPATRARNLTRTQPQPAVPDQDGADWNNGYGDPQTGPAGGGRGGADGSYGDGDSFGGHEPAVRRRRRWPIVTSLLALLVVIIGGGAVVGWIYVHNQYYIADQDGHVTLFRGVNENLAGIGLSSQVRTFQTLPFNELDSSQQSAVTGYDPSSLAKANQTVTSLEQDVSKCRGMYTTLQAWQVKETAYTKQMTAYENAVRAHVKNPKKPVAPPAEPAVPTSGQCAPSSAFGIPASALPGQGGQPGGETTPAASSSASPRASTSPSPRNSA